MTFLFTDVEGSTSLLRRLGERAWAEMLDRQIELIKVEVESCGGSLVSTDGDGCFCAFSSGADALAAGLGIQRRLAAQVWPEGARVRVRVGLHTGPAQPWGDNYVALAVHQAARVASAARGGQVLVSSAAQAAVGAHLPEASRLVGLGQFELRDFGGAQELWALVAPDLDAGPRPRTLSARRHNLPPPRTPFVGRAEDQRSAATGLAESRLLTLTGTGGVGKTRLALEVAAAAVPDFADGVWLVELAPVAPGNGVEQAVAFALEVEEQPGVSLLATLTRQLRSRELLLVLDNAEHVRADAARVVDSLLRGTAVRVFCTSRERLGVAGERVQQVLPMPAPATAEVGIENDAVQLFCERVADARPGWTPSPGTLAAVVEVVRRLDGIPLALELAAARSRSTSLPELARRLGADPRFQLLDSDVRPASDRHGSVRAAIQWSYDLLSSSEQELLPHAAVFPAQFTVAALHAVAGGDLHDVQDLTASLADRSLLTADPSGDITRYGMLEAIRTFCLAQQSRTDSERATRAYAKWAATFARTHRLDGPNAAESMELLLGEQDNLRGPLIAPSAGQGDLSDLVDLAEGLGHFWFLRGRITEAISAYERLLETSLSDHQRARTLLAAGRLIRLQSSERTQQLLEEALMLARRSGDLQLLATTLRSLAYLPIQQGEPAAALPLLDEARALLDEMDGPDAAFERFGVAHARAMALTEVDRHDDAVQAFRELLAEARSSGSLYDETLVLGNLASALERLGRTDEARSAALEGLDLAEQTHDWTVTKMIRLVLANLDRRAGRNEEAAEHFRRLASECSDRGDTAGRIDALEALAVTAGDQSDWAAATEVLDQVAEIRKTSGLRSGREPLDVRALKRRLSHRK